MVAIGLGMEKAVIKALAAQSKTPMIMIAIRIPRMLIQCLLANLLRLETA